MREKKRYIVISFHTTRDAMAFEKKSMELKIAGRLIPIPREITAGCGLAWRIPYGEYESDSKDRIEDTQIPYEQMYDLYL